MTIAEFLLARIAEDEEWARLTSGPDYSEPHDEGAPGHHARVLAECEAKRRIVELHQTTVTMQQMRVPHQPGWEDPEAECDICGWHPVDSACHTLRALALPFADHPDYDEGWKP